MEGPAPVRIDDLTVRHGRVVACHQVSLEVRRGEIVALLGRNGAGKSSLVHCLLGLHRPQGGRALLFGLDSWSHRASVLARVGLVPEEPHVPPTLSLEQVSAASSWILPGWSRDEVGARLDAHGVPRRRSFGRLSKGQKSLGQLILALGHAPELLVLDDPTLGVDRIAADAVFETIAEQRRERSTAVLLTTHDLDAAERLADRFAVLREGLLVASGDLDGLRAAAGLPRGSLADLFAALVAPATDAPEPEPEPGAGPGARSNPDAAP